MNNIFKKKAQERKTRLKKKMSASAGFKRPILMDAQPDYGYANSNNNNFTPEEVARVMNAMASAKAPGPEPTASLRQMLNPGPVIASAILDNLTMPDTTAFMALVKSSDFGKQLGRSNTEKDGTFTMFVPTNSAVAKGFPREISEPHRAKERNAAARLHTAPLFEEKMASLQMRGDVDGSADVALATAFNGTHVAKTVDAESGAELVNLYDNNGQVVASAKILRTIIDKTPGNLGNTVHVIDSVLMN
jgi:uncharacterized surface protein with fasciclin (FAS1) repeats